LRSLSRIRAEEVNPGKNTGVPREVLKGPAQPGCAKWSKLRLGQKAENMLSILCNGTPASTDLPAALSLRRNAGRARPNQNFHHAAMLLLINLLHCL
jgi:hypothetical protein